MDYCRKPTDFPAIVERLTKLWQAKHPKRKVGAVHFKPRSPGAINKHLDRLTEFFRFAINLDREGRLEEALETLDTIGDDDEQIALRAKVARLGTLNKLGRYDATKRLAEELLLGLPEDAPDDQVAAAHAKNGVALWNDTQDAESALACAWTAFEHRKDEPTALWLRPGNRRGGFRVRQIPEDLGRRKVGVG